MTSVLCKQKQCLMLGALVLSAMLAPMLGCAHVEAQEGSQAPGPAETAEVEGEAGFEARQKKFLERMRVMSAWKLTEVLELDEASGAKLFEVLGKYDVRLMERHMALRKAERKLRQGVRGDASDAELTKWTDDVVAAKEALDAMRLEQFREAGKLLDARRRAQLLLFIPRFDKKVRRALREERTGRKGRSGKGRGRGRGADRHGADRHGGDRHGGERRAEP